MRMRIKGGTRKYKGNNIIGKSTSCNRTGLIKRQSQSNATNITGAKGTACSTVQESANGSTARCSCSMQGLLSEDRMMLNCSYVELY